ncbi:MAG: permease, partial [Candidatus Thermoplasmatota archaeon]|nr:permease [Candidatus Thermoplasmatota archaeon]
LILPAIMVILGLFAVWIPNKMIGKHLGHASGIKGVIISIILGTLPTGPLYIAFPMAAVLLAKGAKRSNIIIFLSAWACIKIPQEMVELRFLGLEFMLLRLALTVTFVVMMGISVEKMIGWTERRSRKKMEI